MTRLEVPRGASLDHVLPVTDVNGDPVDVSTFDFTSEVRRGDSRAIPFVGDTVLATIAVDTTNAAAGELRLTMTAGTTEGLPVGVLRWDLRAVAQSDPDDVRYPVVNGPLVVQPTVTRP